MTAEKKRFSFIIILILTAALAFAGAFFTADESAYASSAEGNWNEYSEIFTLLDINSPNSENNPYIIDTAGKLARLSSTVNSGTTYAGNYFRQTAHLDLGAHYFTPIGHGGRTFNGIYDGNDYSLTALTIDATGNDVGLFGRVWGMGTIKNLTINSGSITASGDNVGSFAGYIQNGRIENCVNRATVTAVRTDEQTLFNAGGVVGASDNAVIQNCYNLGIVYAEGYNNVAGISGRLSLDGSGASIISCFNAAPINGSVNVGGIAGVNYGSVQYAYNTSSITGMSISGGVIGVNYGTANEVYNIGDVYGGYAVGMVAGNHVRGSFVNAVFLNKLYDRTISLPGLAQIGPQASGSATGMDYIDLTGVVARLGASVWGFREKDTGTGYTPYLNVFGEASADYGILNLFGQKGGTGEWGTEFNPYYINAAKQFNVIREKLQSGESYADKYFTLDSDVDLGHLSPIGSYEMPFSGSLSGGGHSLDFVISGEYDHVGLFAHLKDSNIINLTVNGTVTNLSNGGKTGILAGESSNLTVNGVTTNGRVSGGAHTGGFVGYGGAEFISSQNNSVVTGNGSSGGFIGTGTTSLDFQSSVNTANISANISAGGFAGESLAAIAVQHSISLGMVQAEGENSFAGGFIGKAAQGLFTQSFSSNSIIKAWVAGGFAGGFAGKLDGAATVTECYSTSHVEADNAGGHFGDAWGIHISKSYFSGTVQGTVADAIVAVGTVNSDFATDVYYNIDFASTTIGSATAKTAIELTQLTIDGFTLHSAGSYYGYFPYITVLFEWEYTLPSVRYNYFAAGTGESHAPYEIASEAHLVNMQRFIASEPAYNDKHYILRQNITVINEFLPIASIEIPFSGRFDGRYYTIYGLVIDGGDYSALFAATADGSEITKVNLMPVEVSPGVFRGSVTGVNYVGGLVAYAKGVVNSSSNRLSVTGVDYVGGIAGYYNTTSGSNPVPLRESFNTGNITGLSFVGGIAGEASGIFNCFNSGQIRGVESVGGIVGLITSTVTNAYNSGELMLHPEYSFGNYFGGIAGTTGALGGFSSISLCYTIGSAVVGGITAFGALVGNNLNTFNGAVSLSYYNSDILPSVNIIGGGYTANYSQSYGRTTVQMAGTTALSTGNMDGLHQGYSVSGGISDVADYSVQLDAFINISILDNIIAETFIKAYSMQSVMLRLYGIDQSNIAEWGSASNPYLIEGLDHLNTLRLQVAAGHTYQNKTFLIMDDITTGEFAPIGIYYAEPSQQALRRPFLGTLDGGGHFIYNLVINEIVSGSSAALVGYLGTGGVIKNLIIESGEITGLSYVGSFAGYVSGSIINCLSRASVTGSERVGGIAGGILATLAMQIQSCVYQGTLTGENASTRGGIVGVKNGDTSIYNSWYVVEDSTLRHNDYGAALLVDRNGSVRAEVHPYAALEEKITFIAYPNAGFGFVYKDTRNIEISFSTASGSSRMPLYATQYSGEEKITWRAHFTKQVMLGAIQNGTAAGGGHYYEGETVTVNVRPNMGYRLRLEEEYDYTGDGENISCSWVMGNSDFTFTAECVIFGHEAGQITYGDGESVVTNVDASGNVSSPLIVFDYDGQIKIFAMDIPSTNVTLTPQAAIYRVTGSSQESVTEAKNANSYRFEITLWQEQVAVGKKTFDFNINRRQLTLDAAAIMAEESYYKKQYDKESADGVIFSSAYVTNLVEGDSIGLTAVRTFYDGETPSASVSNNKDLRFLSFVITGFDANNYLAPQDLTDIGGTPLKGIIIKRQALVIVSQSELSKQFDGSAPIVEVVSVEGEMTGDNLNVAKYKYTLVDEEGNAIFDDGSWSVGRYLITIESMTGNQENYDISIEEAYFVITRKIITSIDFQGASGLRYSGRNYADGNEGGIMAFYNSASSARVRADLIFYKDGVLTEECINAGNYMVKAVIADTNYTVDEEKSLAFTVAKITPTLALSIGAVSDVDFSTQNIQIELSGETGKGSVEYEVLQGIAEINGGKITPLAAGIIKFRAKENESENYLMRYSPAVSFNVAKSVLTAELGEFSAVYGETPVITINYTGFVRGENGDKSLVKGLVEPTAVLNGILNVSEEGYPVSLNNDGYAHGYIIDVSSAVGRLTITPKAVRVTANAKHKLYGDNDPVFSYTASGGGQLFGALTRVAGEDAGKYIIEQGTLTAEHNPNYIITFIPDYLTINKRELNVIIPGATKVYGAADPVFTFEVNPADLKLSDTPSIVTGAITRDSGENVGEYSLREVYVTAGSNYTVIIQPINKGRLAILKATPVLFSTPYAAPITYGDTLGKSAITAATSVPGSFSWISPNTMPSVQNSGITVYDAAFFPADSRNYNSVNITLTLTVQKRNASVAFIGETSHVFDGKDKRTLKASARNILDGDDVEVTLTYSADYLISAGTYTVTASINDVNYRLSNEVKPLEIKIFKAQVVVKAEDAEITDGEKFVPVLSYDGFKGNDNEFSLSGEVKVNVSPKADGTSLITPSGAIAENYDFIYISGILTIHPKEVKAPDISVRGNGLKVGTEVSIKEIPSKAMTDYVENKIKVDVKGYTLNTYSAVTFSAKPSGKLTYSIAMELSESEKIVVVKSDGAVMVISDYTYENGIATFESEEIQGVGSVREKTLLELLQPYLIYGGIALGVIAIIGVFVSVAVSNARAKKRRTPVYKD